MFTHLSTQIITSVSLAARNLTRLAAREAAVLSAIAMISVISATVLVAQDGAAANDARSRAARFVAPLDGVDPNEGRRFEEPGLLDKAYDLVFGAKAIPTSNLTTTVNSCAVDACTPSATDNDFRRINNAILTAGSGDTIILNGVFDWSEPFAAADWAKGSDYTASTGDDYSILAPAGLNNITIQAQTPGVDEIKGPGDIPTFDLEGAFQFYSGGTNSGWTIQNLRFVDIDNPIGFYHAGGPTTAYSGTTIQNNYFKMPIDATATIGTICPPSFAAAECFQNIAIHFAFGANQTITGNTIEIPGNGVSDTVNNLSSTVVTQSNTSGGAVYDGLQITNNAVNILNPASPDPETIRGIWENGHAHFSNITVSGNSFNNPHGDAATNRQVGIRVTSHSSASTTVAYSNNVSRGANIGVQFLSSGGTTHPVQFTGNQITGNHIGVRTNTGSIANFQYNRIAGNALTAIDNLTLPGTSVVANDNWWGCNYGPGVTGVGCPVAPNANAGVVTAATFLTMGASASPTNIVSGGTSTITATLTNVPNGTPVSFGSANAFGATVGSGPTLVGGTQTATYTGAAADAGAGVATSTVDGQTMNTAVTVHPKVNSINRKTPLPQQTNLTTVVFEVEFSSPVVNVDDTDFVVTQMVGPAVGTVTGVTCASPFNKCDITVLATGGSGQLRLDLVDDNTIGRRLAPAIVLGGPVVGDGNFNSGQDYIFDLSPPSVSSITKLDADPTAATSVQFSVNFNEPVSGVDTGDFALSGTSSGSIASVSGSGSGPYTVTVNTIVAPSLSGTLGLNVVDNDTIIDGTLPTPNPLGGPGAGNGNFTGPLYTVDQTVPTGTLAQAISQSDPTSAMTVTFTVVFTDALTISGFTASDVTVATGPGTAFNASTPNVVVSAPTISAPTTTYSVVVSNMDQPGQVTASIGAGSVADAVGNSAADVVEGDNTVYYTFGLTTLVVDQDGFASNVNFPASCADATPSAYTTIQAAVNAASAGNTIKVCPATYDEDVDVNKSLTLIGADKATTIIRGQKAGDPGDLSGSTVRLLAANIDISNFTITREGNNTTDWNSNLNVAGLSIQSNGVAPGAVIHDNNFVGNRNGLDINNSGTDIITVRNNVIDGNRTGVILRNQTDNVTFVENSISANWTIGVLFIDGSGGTNVPLNQCRNCAFINNKISDNWYSQIQDRQSGGSLPAPGTNLKNFQGNWFGSTAPAVNSSNTTEPGYAAQIPVIYGGVAVAPGLPPSIDGTASANFRYNLPLTSGTDTNVETTPGRGTFGFQGAPLVVNSVAPSFAGWFFADDLVGTGSGSGEFELGPGTTPLGTGSARLSVDANGRRILGTLSYAGIRLDRITKLGYSSYQVSGNAAAAPSLQFDVDDDVTDGNTAYQGRLVYEPYQDNTNTVAQNTWQTWNAINATGKWWASPGSGIRPIAAVCTQAVPCTWAQLLSSFPNAGVRGVAQNGVLLFRAGGPTGTNFTGYVDKFDIGISTGEIVHDFEGDGTPDPTVVSSVREDASPSSAASVDFIVTFSEPVIGVDPADFTLATTGSIAGASVTGATTVGSTPSASWKVTVNTGTGSGDIRLDTVSGGITDVAGNPLSTGFTTGEAYTMDRDLVTVTVEQAGGQGDPTNTLPINFTVQFSEAVTGFDNPATDLTLGGVATAATITPVDGDTYTVSVTAASGFGIATVSIPAAVADDNLGNDNSASTSADNSVYYTFGLTTLVVDLDGMASDTDCNALTPTAYTTIQSAIDAAVAGNTIKVCPATYPEDVNVNKSLTIVGVAGAATTIIEGPIGGSGATVLIGAGNVDISGFTITRAGNNTTDWNNPGLNSSGISMNAGTGSGVIVHDNIFVGNRTGIDINNNGTNTITVRNNVIDNNRTGVILRNQTDNVTFVENSISDNWTVGILFLDASGGTNSPLQQARNAAFINNKISGNWYGQLVDRQSGGSLPAPGTTNFKNFQGNWLGTTSPVVTTANSTEPGYAGQVPVIYGGVAVPPGGQPDIAGPASANIRYNLPLTSGTDTNVETTTGRGTFGFQGAPIVVDGPEVNPIDGWGYITETPTGTGEFESGPIGAPLGTGSSRISITSGGGQAFGTLNYGGIRMDRMTSLKYSSYQVGAANVAPYLAFDFDNDLDDGNNAFQGRLVFEPEIDTPGSVLQSTWQNWDARAGKWWATGGLLAGTCTQGSPCTFATILGTHPNAGVRRVASFGALLFKLGSGPVNTTGFVDNFEIGISTGEIVHDFEGDGTPDPTVVSSVRATPPNPSSASSVDFTVTFSEPVIGVDAADFTLATTGTIAGASVTGATTVGPAPSAVWTVSVNTGTGSGDIRLDTSAGPGITDVAGNPLSTGFTTGEAYTMDRDLVTVTVEQAGGQGDPTNTLPINFTVQFSETVTGFDNPATDLTLGGVGTTATITPVDGDTYTVAVTAASGFGFVTVSVPASVADDNLGNDNSASTSADNSVNYTFGSTVLMVDDDGLAVDGNCGALVPNSAYTTIHAAVAAAGTGNTIKVCPGTYTTPPTVAVNVSNLTITAAEATKPLVQASGTADAFDVTATGVTIQNLEIQKLGTGDQHHMIRVQANGFQGLGNYIHGPSWQTPNHVSRAFILNAGLTGWLIDGNTIENLRQPAYFTTGSGTVSNNTATGTKGWVNDGGLITFTNNTFGQTCLPCDTDIALLAATTSPAYEAFYSAANNLVISAANNNAHIDVQFTAAADSGRAVTYVDDTAAPGGDGRVGTPHQSIQTAIFKAGPNLVDGTLPGGTVNVAAGTYTEQITVNRLLLILGPNAAIDPNTGSRVAEAVIRAAVGDTDPFDGANDENSIMVTITNTADGTVFKGFTVDGDNPLITSNYLLNGADVDAYGGISGNGNINPALDISYNIVKNMGEFGIEVYGDVNAPGVRTNSRIANNKVDNVVGWFFGNAIFAGDNASTNVEDNVVTQSFGGIMIHHFNGQVTSRPNSVVNGNRITAFGYPIWFNLHYAYSGNGYTVSNNTIDSYVEQDAITFAPRASNSKFEGDKETGFKRPRRVSDNEPQNSVGGWGRWIGIKVESVNGLVPATFTDNNIDGNRALLLGDTPPYTMIDGFRITNPSTTSSNIVIKENNITDTNRGIAHTADALVDINCNNIYGNQIGIYIGSGLDYDNNPESADIGATIFNNNILGNAVFGVQADTGTALVNNAQSNYWGAADGPSGSGPGTGDSVSTLVNFAGFLTIPSTCSPVAPPPTVTIEQVGPDPTNTSPINFTVTFSEAVTDFDDASDIALSGTAGATTVVITGGPTVYNVAVSGMASDGTVIADVVAGAATGANGANVASSSLDNTVLYDATPPTVTVEQKLGQNDPTNASPVEFTVTFSEPTTNFVTGDVNLAASTAPGTLVGTVTGGPTVFNVAVTGMTGSGTVVASVDAGVATDAANNGNSASTSADNSVLYDVTAPAVTIDQQTVPAQADPTSASPVNFSIVITDASAISGFTASDVTIATGAGTAFGGFAVPNVVLTGGPTTFNAAVSGMNQSGLVTATIAGGTFVDAAGNANAASTSSDNNVQFNLVNTNVTVTPSAMLGWSFVQENAGVASGRMVTGPATPPLGSGSARITVDATAGQAFMKDAYSGVRLADITAMSFSGYQHAGANPSIHATLSFDVDSDVTDGVNGYQGRIVYEPYNDPANTFTPATWQNFDAMSPTARFWGSGSGPARPFSNACPQSAPCTKAQILGLFPNLGVRNNVPMTSIGRVIFKVGSLAAPGLDASVDNLVIGVNSVNDTYNFDEQPPTVAIANATIKETEAGQTLNFSLTRTGVSGLVTSVTVNTSDGSATVAGSDYTALVNQVVTIPASANPTESVNVSVPIGGDSTVENDESFTVTISNAANAAITTATATGTIENNDVELSFALASPSVGESDGTATITVNRNGATANAAGVSYATSAGTANPGPAGPFNPIDYVAASAPISIPGAGTSTTFNITINPDLISEVNETVILTLSTVVAGPGDNVTIVGTNPSTLTIVDDDGGGVVSVSGNITKYTGGGGIENVTVSLFDGVTTVTTTTNASGFYSFSGIPSGTSIYLTPDCVPANPTCNGYIYDASAREYLNVYSSLTGANFIGYLGDNPRDITFVDTVQPSAGANIVVPVTIMSQGTENSADFVLLYDDTKIDYVSETCGVGAPSGCSVSSAPFPGGRKFELSLDPGVTYTAGLRELIRVTFAQDTVLPTDFNTPVTFAATPRSVANTSGISVPADYVNGLVIFAKGFEVDIAGGLPANSGYGDGAHNNGDIVRIRNLVSGAATVNPSINEFQRADSAPYATRGDGKLNAGDTTVARRHVTGDLVGIFNPAAGPTVAIPFVDGLPSEIYGSKERNANALPPVTMTIVDRNAIRGANVTVAIDLVSEGIETGFSYSIQFDPTRLQMPTGATCPQVTLGSGWHLPATLDTNCTQAAMGRIGVNAFFNTVGTTFVPGNRQVLLMTFFVPVAAPLGPTPLSFTNIPVDDYTSDVNGDPVATLYDPGDVTIVATPTSSAATVAGQVVNAGGIAVNRAQVSLTSSTGVVYRGTTNGLGNFVIDGVPAGSTYIVTVSAKGYAFTPVSLNVTDNIGKIELRLE